MPPVINVIVSSLEHSIAKDELKCGPKNAILTLYLIECIDPTYAQRHGACSETSMLLALP